MEAWHDDARVRPIPIDDDPTLSKELPPRAPGDGDGPKRPWLPLMLAAVAALIVVGSVATFGAVQDDDPPPVDIAALLNPPPETEDAATTTTLGGSLSETIPGIEDRLTLIVIGRAGPTALLWDPTFILPKEAPLDTDPMDNAVYSASFDSSGRFLALGAEIPGSAGATVSVGVPTSVGIADLTNVDSYLWHATEVGRFAWVAPSADGTPHLYTANADPLGRTLGEGTDLGQIDDDEVLVRWDSLGFILDASGETTVFRGPWGEVVSTIDSAVVATSATTIVTAPQRFDRTRLTVATLRTRSGEIISNVIAQSFSQSETEIDERVRTLVMSRGSDLVARIDMDPTKTRLEVSGPTLSEERIVEHDNGLLPIGFTSTDRYFVFGSDGGNDLIFVDWNNGSIHELSIPDQYEVIAFDIG